MRRLSAAVLAREGRGRGLSDRIHRCAHARRLPRRVDSRGIRRHGTAAARRGRDSRGSVYSGLPRCGRSRADVYDGDRPETRKRRAEAQVPSAHRGRQAAVAGVRRDGAHHRIGHDATQDARDQDGPRLHAQRAEDLHVTRAAFRLDARARAHDAARRSEKPLPRHLDLPHRHSRIARQRTRDQAAERDGEPSHDGSFLRRSRSAGGQPDRRRRERVSATSWTA